MKTVSTLVVLVLCVSALLAAQVKATTEQDVKSMRDIDNGLLVPTLKNSVEHSLEGMPRRLLWSSRHYGYRRSYGRSYGHRRYYGYRRSYGHYYGRRHYYNGQGYRYKSDD